MSRYLSIALQGAVIATAATGALAFVYAGPDLFVSGVIAAAIAILAGTICGGIQARRERALRDTTP